MNAWLTVPQRRLTAPGLIALLVVGSLMMPLSLDMYTPAIPHMTGYFKTTDFMVNLTVVGYFVFYAVSLLLFGPFSDRYGRKPVLVASLAVYAAGGALCALSPSIEALIDMRMVQAVGAGAFCAVSTAIVKDAFIEEKRQSVLFVIQVMFVIGPVVAPIVGAAVLQFADWRGTFWVLSGIGAVCLVGSILFRETLPRDERFQGSAFGTLGTLGTVLRNRGFTLFLFIAAAYEIPYMAYVAVGSHVYITTFGTTDIEYSLFFAVPALITAVSPALSTLALKAMSMKRYLTIQFVLAVASGALMLATGHISKFAFCLPFLIFAFTESVVRPLSTNICLTQQEGDTGAAAALINFMRAALGVVGMSLVVLPWPSYIVGISTLMVVTMAVALIGWFALLRSSVPLALVKVDDDGR